MSLGSGSSSQSGRTRAQLLNYAECMRAHGIKDFPDPVPSPLGGYSFHLHITSGSDLDPNTPRNQSAAKACQKDVPPSITNLTPAGMAANALKWSVCMRAHGEPASPEPKGQGLIKIDVDPNSLQFQKAEGACQKLGRSGFDIRIPTTPPEDVQLRHAVGLVGWPRHRGAPELCERRDLGRRRRQWQGDVARSG